ncbi:MAG: acetyl-CoA carboxylase biotin carboxyl carrier protein subunit [Rhodospirillaceae bacterium]|jgi:biotin carboxyl carrier protein|nr:acetyl-CoA carboxylase biotin carboxyl carrier protein subunit [Rhodospirillaceae bacterium]|tara:strand:+ start:270 stop:488 length:219 start_codon:yes stop_codon:yes gene_type:complete
MAQQIHTDVSGSVWKVLVKPGDKVKAGDILFILEVMKTEVPFEAGADGEVVAVHISEDSGMVEEDTLAIEIS